MVWRVFAHDGLYDLPRISERMNSEIYQAVLHNHFTPFRPLLGGSGWIFR